MEYFNVGKPNIADLCLLVHEPYWRRIIVSELCADVFATFLSYALHMDISKLNKVRRNGMKIDEIGNNNEQHNPNQPKPESPHLNATATECKPTSN
jgi:hypothetical protein